MPAWEQVDLPRLQSALDAPRQGGFGREYYPTLPAKTAILLYLMVKNHAWVNGNKRMAFVSTLVFIGLNGHVWDAEGVAVRAHITWVAASDPRLSKFVFRYLRRYFRQNLRPAGVLDMDAARAEFAP